MCRTKTSLTDLFLLKAAFAASPVGSKHKQAQDMVDLERLASQATEPLDPERVDRVARRLGLEAHVAQFLSP